MSSYTVNCPECGKSFEYGEVRETVFCSSCGKKLRITWRIESVALDDGIPRGPVSASSGPSRPQQNNDGEIPKGYLRVLINLPQDCLDLKGSFSHFMIFWDDKEIGFAGRGECIELRTLSRTHKLEIKQVNKKAVGSSERLETFQVPINGNRTLNVKVEGNRFTVE